MRPARNDSTRNNSTERGNGIDVMIPRKTKFREMNGAGTSQSHAAATRRKEKKKCTGKKRKQRKSAEGYQIDDFVGNTDDSDDSELPPGPANESSSGVPGESEQKETDPLWMGRNQEVTEALEGDTSSFKRSIVCVICRFDGARPIGTDENNWYDGFVQPARNFSPNVSGGNYGRYISKAFCMIYNSNDQEEFAPILKHLY